MVSGCRCKITCDSMPNGHTDPPLSPRCTGPLTHGPSSTSRTSRGVRGCLSGAWVAPVRVGDLPTTTARYPPPHDNLQAAAVAACEVCCRIRWTRANDVLGDLKAASLLQRRQAGDGQRVRATDGPAARACRAATARREWRRRAAIDAMSRDLRRSKTREKWNLKLVY